MTRLHRLHLLMRVCQMLLANASELSWMGVALRRRPLGCVLSGWLLRRGLRSAAGAVQILGWGGVFDVPETREHDRRTLNALTVGIEVSAPRAVESFLDMAHFPYVHAGVLGEEPHTEVAESRVEERDGELWGFRLPLLPAAGRGGLLAGGAGLLRLPGSASNGGECPHSTVAGCYAK